MNPENIPSSRREAAAPLHTRPERHPLPPWFRVQLNLGHHYVQMKRLTEEHSLHTICKEARCPNIWECWNNKTATLMILGDTCTRRCAYCSVHTGRPDAADPDEARRVAIAVERLGLQHVVITSPNRDDLADGGSAAFASTIGHIRRRTPDCLIEVLIPDFKGSTEALDLTLHARPDILNHNIETVPRLFPSVRPQGNYRRSLDILAYAKQLGIVTKSGLIVGMGESMNEVEAALHDLRSVRCEMLTIGQYLQPTTAHREVSRFYNLSEFEALRNVGAKMGFRHIESGPLVRSSYHAERQGREIRH